MTHPLRATLVALLLSACGGVDEAQVEAVLATTGDPVQGEVEYEGRCERCHGVEGDGEGDEQGPVLAGTDLGTEDIVRFMLIGPGRMPSFDDRSDTELADLAAYVASLQ